MKLFVVNGFDSIKACGTWKAVDTPKKYKGMIVGYIAPETLYKDEEENDKGHDVQMLTVTLFDTRCLT